MKNYLFKTKISHMDKTIKRLQEENKMLYDEIKLLDKDNLKHQLDLAISMYEEYEELCEELRDLKKRYLSLISDMDNELKKMRKIK